MGAKRKPRQTPMLSHHTLTEWDSDSSDDDLENVPVQKARMLEIGEEHEVGGFYKARFEDLQPSACIVIGKVWVKLIEPKKQTHHPYTKGNISAPLWWPSTIGINKVRHKDPEHLLRSGKIAGFTR
jgi:hypothetical protein